MNESFLVRLELTRTEKVAKGYRHYKAILDTHSSSFSHPMPAGIVKLPCDGALTIHGMEASLDLEDFLKLFKGGAERVAAGGLQVGRWLYSSLFVEPSPLRAHWEAARSEMERAVRPLRLEILFPHPSQRVDSEILLEELPFELLADERSLLFQNRGYTLVRCYAGHKKKTFDIPRRRPGSAGLGKPKAAFV